MNNSLDIIEYWSDIENVCTPLESEIVLLRSYGLTYKKIAPLVNKHPVTICRKMSKIRQKLAFLKQ